MLSHPRPPPALLTFPLPHRTSGEAFSLRVTLLILGTTESEGMDHSPAVMLLLLFIMVYHLLTHRLATSHSHLQFGAMQGVTEEPQAHSHPGPHMPWFDWQAIWGIHTSDMDSKHEFVVAA